MYDDVDFMTVSDQLKLIMHAFGVHSTTIQPEFVGRPNTFKKRLSVESAPIVRSLSVEDTIDDEAGRSIESRACGRVHDENDLAHLSVDSPFRRTLGAFHFSAVDHASDDEASMAAAQAYAVNHARLLAVWRAENASGAGGGSEWCHEPICARPNCAASACCALTPAAAAPHFEAAAAATAISTVTNNLTAPSETFAALPLLPMHLH